MAPLHGLKVVRSKIHGYGVVALRRFERGEIVVYGDGVLYTEDQEFDDSYALVLHNPDGDDHPPVYYDLADQTRWINHSCGPNTEIDSEWDPVAKVMSAWWVATRDIELGEELTYDYAFSGHLAEVCNCGEPECRGLIVDEDELDDVPEALRAHIKPAALDRKRTSAAASEGSASPSAEPASSSREPTAAIAGPPTDA